MNNVGRTASKNWLSLVLIFLFTFSVSLVGARFVRSILVGNSLAETKESNEVPSIPDPAPAVPDAIELQPILDSWLTNINDEVSVVIYDLDRNEVAASYNSDTVFPTSALNGLILAYNGYRQINIGAETLDSYGTCLNDLIQNNDIDCTESILGDPVRSERITEFITSVGMTQTTDFGRQATATDFSKLLQHLWRHEDLSLANWASLQDSMLGQQTLDSTDQRQGLPSGFSTARVYSKNGGEIDDTGTWLSYGDLALVEFVKTNRHLAIVVLGENLTDLSNISRLSTLVEGKVIEE